MGYEFSINDVIRKLTSTTGVGLNSEHIWAISIDMSIREARPGTESPSTNLLYGLDQTPEGAALWREFGVADIAAAYDLRWGGNWTKGSWKYDTVHFGAMPEWSSYSRGVTKLLFKQVPLLKTQLENKNRTTRVNTTKTSSNPDGIDYINNFVILQATNLQNYLFIEEDEKGDLKVFGDPSKIEMLRGEKEWIGL